MNINLNHISKRYEQNQVLKDFNATFWEDGINCLMGASGIGKTTVVNILMGMTKPDTGEIQGMRGKKIAVVFQEDRLIEHWDSIKNVRLVCDKSMTDERIEQELQKVGLEEDQNKPVQNLSGGMRRRVAIVRAMLAKSDLIIMDEPFKGLDAVLKENVMDYVKQKTQGKTVIIVTHDKEEVHYLGARLITIE